MFKGEFFLTRYEKALEVLFRIQETNVLVDDNREDVERLIKWIKGNFGKYVAYIVSIE